MNRIFIIFALLFVIVLANDFDIIKLPFGRTGYTHKELYRNAKIMCYNMNSTRCIVFDPNSRKVAIGAPAIDNWNCAVTKMKQVLDKPNNPALDLESRINLYITSDIIDDVAAKCNHVISDNQTIQTIQTIQTNQQELRNDSLLQIIGKILCVVLFAMLFQLALCSCYEINKQPVPGNPVNIDKQPISDNSNNVYIRPATNNELYSDSSSDDWSDSDSSSDDWSDSD